MRLYEGAISDFNKAVLENQIADQIGQSYERYYRRRPSPSEHRSWQQSFNFLKNSFEYTGLTGNKIIIEYELPYSTRRIDVLLFGNDQQKTDSVVLLELNNGQTKVLRIVPRMEISSSIMVDSSANGRTLHYKYKAITMISKIS